jgi:hypothetical protein
MPLTPVVPAPAEPAFGVPTALPDPAAAPAPVFWANEGLAAIRAVTSASAVAGRIFDIGSSPGWDEKPTARTTGLFLTDDRVSRCFEPVLRSDHRAAFDDLAIK